MDAGLRIDSYQWRDGREPMLRFGPEDGPLVVLVLPLFEEANRTRAFGVAILRALAERGIGGVLPDLPGQGESERPIADVSILDLQGAYAEAVAQAGLNFVGYGVAIRSGALLDALAPLDGRWHFAPQRGSDLLEELRRLRQAATGRPLTCDHWWFAGDVPDDVRDLPIEIGGNLIGTHLLTDLTSKEPFDRPGVPRRVVRLVTDPRAADRKVEGSPLWRRVEPGNDVRLAEELADDIAEWVRSCEG